MATRLLGVSDDPPPRGRLFGSRWEPPAAPPAVDLIPLPVREHVMALAAMGVSAEDVERMAGEAAATGTATVTFGRPRISEMQRRIGLVADRLGLARPDTRPRMDADALTFARPPRTPDSITATWLYRGEPIPGLPSFACVRESYPGRPTMRRCDGQFDLELPPMEAHVGAAAAELVGDRFADQVWSRLLAGDIGVGCELAGEGGSIRFGRLGLQRASQRRPLDPGDPRQGVVCVPALALLAYEMASRAAEPGSYDPGHLQLYPPEPAEPAGVTSWTPAPTTPATPESDPAGWVVVSGPDAGACLLASRFQVSVYCDHCSSGVAYGPATFAALYRGPVVCDRCGRPASGRIDVDNLIGPAAVLRAWIARYSDVARARENTVDVRDGATNVRFRGVVLGRAGHVATAGDMAICLTAEGSFMAAGVING